MAQENQPDFSHTPTDYEQYAGSTPTLNAINHNNQTPQINPYAQDTNGFGAQTYFQGTSSYTQPV